MKNFLLRIVYLLLLAGLVLPVAAGFTAELADLLGVDYATSPNRRPTDTLSLTVADAAAAEVLAQNAAALARGRGLAVLDHHVDETAARRRLVMEFGPEGGRTSTTLSLIWSPPRWSGPRLAIIIDDCGARDPRSSILLDLPVTPSVLPFREYSSAFAATARAADRRVLLHLPCEPLGSENPGPGALRLSHTDDELRRRIAEALADVGPVDGVNNHMGSRLTADRRAMAVVLTDLAGRGLYFIDSYTHHGSVVGEVAAELGLSVARRDIFLDNSTSPARIEAQLRRALELAVERDGPVIAIGHDRDGTLDAIARLLPLAAELGVALVPPEACLTP
ncbi:MAG: hypothetical protein GF403_09595 [Candidatus Coatesbacteria bacterium]|nr:hypothetical protein [Candidatus Coatesbacteria bacterium]